MDSETVALYNQSLNNIGIYDGREIKFTKDLRDKLSEGALHRYRAIVEIENVINWLISPLPFKLEMSPETADYLRNFVKLEKFDSYAVLEYDHIGRNGIGPLEHDVKAVEMYLRELFSQNSLEQYSEVIHFPMTSEDGNNIAYNLMIRSAINKVWLPKYLEVCDKLAYISTEYKGAPIDGLTHGMKASPTTIGKKFGYFLDRFTDSLDTLKTIKPNAKWGGATGNSNPLRSLLPEFDILDYSKKFVESFDFEYSPVENQRLSHQRILRLLGEMSMINTIGADLCQNVRNGVSRGWLYQTGNTSHVGSSTMAHKINPWFFEVGQGHFEISNALIKGAQNGLLMTMDDRDLTDHPWERIYSEMVAGSLVGLSYISDGLDTLQVDTSRALNDLRKSPEVLSEDIQCAGRILGVKDIYMKIKNATRGKDVTYDTLQEIIRKELPDSEIRDRLLSELPENYTGIADKLADLAAERYEIAKRTARHGIFKSGPYIDAAVFDLDNTLHMGDKDELLARLSAISDELGMGYNSQEILQFGKRSDYKEMRKLMVEEYNRRNPEEDPMTEGEFQEVNNKYSGQFDDKFYLAAGSAELLDYLGENDYKRGLVTTRGSNSLPRLLKNYGLTNSFDAIINRDSCKERKPHPKPIILALEKLNRLPGESMYFGDKQEEDLPAAKSIGMFTTLVSENPPDPYGSRPDYWAKNPKDILTNFKRPNLIA